jgi:hypothetical protein
MCRYWILFIQEGVHSQVAMAHIVNLLCNYSIFDVEATIPKPIFKIIR